MAHMGIPFVGYQVLFLFCLALGGVFWVFFFESRVVPYNSEIFSDTNFKKRKKSGQFLLTVPSFSFLLARLKPVFVCGCL